MRNNNRTPPLSACRKRAEDLRQARNTWETAWKDIRDYVSPGRGQFRGEKPGAGERRDDRIINSTALLAHRVLAAGMQSGLTSPARPWFRLAVHDPALGQYGPVRNWLDSVQDRMLTVLSRSNVYNGLHVIYGEVGAFGVGAVILLGDYRDVIRCRPYTCGEFCLGVGPDLRVDTVLREYSMAAAQMVGEFGDESVSEAVRTAYRDHSTEKQFQVVHLIEPNDDRVEGLPGARGMAWRSLYWEEAGDRGVEDERAFLRVGGFEELPVMAPRWDVIGSDAYGRGPGWVVLGDAKMLQKMEEDKLIALDKLINPPMEANANLMRTGVNVLPGGVTFIENGAQGTSGLKPAYQINPDLQSQMFCIQEVQKRIESGMFQDLFLMLAQTDRRQITAREVAERHEEKLLMLGPVLERLESELLDPLIDRTFNLMLRAGLIPPPPEELAGMPLKVEYVSILAQAQRMVGITAIEQVAGFVGNLAGVKPEVLDKFDADEAVDRYGEMLGVPPGVVVPDEIVAKVREQRAKAQAEQAKAQEAQAMMAQLTQGAQAASTTAQAAKLLAETDTGGNNALQAILNGAGGM